MGRSRPPYRTRALTRPHTVHPAHAERRNKTNGGPDLSVRPPVSEVAASVHQVQVVTPVLTVTAPSEPTLYQADSACR